MGREKQVVKLSPAVRPIKIMLAMNLLKTMARTSRVATTPATTPATTVSRLLPSLSSSSSSFFSTYPTEASTPPKKKPAMITQKVQLSTALATTLNITGDITRPEITKALWVYIKANNLQDPNDGRQIVNDASFRDIFGTDHMSMFEMTKLVQQHITKL